MGGWNPESGEKIARDFASLEKGTCGYIIETDGKQYRFCFIYPNDAPDRGRWFATEGEAIRDAARDWDEAGSLMENPTYLSTLRREATKAERREGKNG